MKVVADNIEDTGLEEIQKLRINIEHLNRVIEDDPRLGKPFCLGHSFFTPIQSSTGIQEWLNDVVDSQIKPLLLDYWPDNAPHVDTQCNTLKGISALC